MTALSVLEKEFDKYYFNMYYDKSMQVVGKMYMNNYTSQARYCELLIYYEQRKFDKIRHILKNKHIEKLEERELYLCSLIELQLYDEFRKEYALSGLISRACVAYIGGLLISQGLSIESVNELGNHNVLVNRPTYMERRYKWFVANTIADIYLINEEKLQMIFSNMPEEDIDCLQNTMNRKLESIRINDDFREQILDRVKNNEHISIEQILWFPIAYCGKIDKYGKIKAIQCFDTIFDIVNYLDICRRIDYQAVELDGIVEYGKRLFDAVIEGNEYVIHFLKKLYIDVSYHRRFIFDDTSNTSIADTIYYYLNKYAPYVLDEIEEHSEDKKIISILTPRGKLAYRAALWQFESAMNSDYGTTDAGMLCLSYMRILELEINERIIKIIKMHSQEILLKYENFINHFDDEKEKEKHNSTWEYVIRVLTEKNKALELGSIYAVFDLLKNERFKRSNPDVNMSTELRKVFHLVLNEEGIKALNDGTLAKMIERKVRDKYRNPPAHTRYVRLEVALECRDYVDRNLVLLNSFIL